ncbi:MAG: prolipoprotein diacylglyceryl transferase [Dehalococcoidia bacterium]|nr:prolipoprotein diacylglyceryl transferase [Dehalococcoidia bacterium]
MPNPMLAIEIPWSPNITEIGGFLLTWHGLFTAIGILVGVQLSLRMAKVVRYDEDDAYTLALVGVPSGIVGARLLFVAEHWDFYGSNPAEIFAITEGGISIWGAVLGGVLGALLFGLWRGYPIGRGLDIASFGLITGMAIGRIGDLINGEHLAKATDLPWGATYTNADSPAFAHSIAVGPHHPATTYELLGDIAILGLLFYVFYGVFRHRAGLTFFTFLIGYAVMRFFLTYLRLDSAEGPLGLIRVPQTVSVLVVLGAIPFVYYFATRPPVPAPGEDLPPPPPAPEPASGGPRRDRRAATRSGR